MKPLSVIERCNRCETKVPYDRLYHKFRVVNSLGSVIGPVALRCDECMKYGVPTYYTRIA